MPEEQEFADLIRRVRAGDEQAAAALVRLYEPEVRRIIRTRLTDLRLRPLLDSQDICQSVLGNFFVRAASGQFELDTPQQLLKLLVTMARNKLRDQARKQGAGRRVDRHRVDAGPGVLEGVVDSGDSPSQTVAAQELLQTIRSRLSDAERFLADQRAQGRPWPDIAAEVGDTPESLRKRLTRAIDRVLRQLGLDDMTEG
jgi:RNA polymerase sigma-70 factor (ECF subfamily)